MSQRVKHNFYGKTKAFIILYTSTKSQIIKHMECQKIAYKYIVHKETQTSATLVSS